MLLFAHFGAQWKGSEKKSVNKNIKMSKCGKKHYMACNAMGERKVEFFTC